MKKILFYTILAASVLFAGCKKVNIEEQGGMGTVSFAIHSDNSGYQIKAVTLPEVDAKTFSVEIRNSDGSYVKNFASFAEVPSVLEMPAGDYTVTAGTPNAKKVSWDQPVYSGKANFTIVVGKPSNVELTCSISNMLVSINPTAEFMKEVTSFEVTVMSDDSTLVWDKAAVEAKKVGYFAVSPLQVWVKGTHHNGQEVAQINLNINKVAAKDHHIINLDAKVTGSMGPLNITIDNTVVDKNQNIHVPGVDFKPIPDEPDPDQGGTDPVPPVPSTVPTIVWTENPDFNPYPLAETMNVELTVEAKETISSFIVKVQSPTSAFLDIVGGMVDPKNAHIAEGYVDLDLIGDQTAITNLADVGLPVGEQLSGKTSVPFSLSGLLPMILGFGPDQGSTHTFTLTVTDAKDQTLSQALPFVVQ